MLGSLNESRLYSLRQEKKYQVLQAQSKVQTKLRSRLHCKLPLTLSLLLV